MLSLRYHIAISLSHFSPLCAIFNQRQNLAHAVDIFAEWELEIVDECIHTATRRKRKMTTIYTKHKIALSFCTKREREKVDHANGGNCKFNQQ